MKLPRPGLVLLLFLKSARVQRKRAALTIAAIAWGSLSLILLLSFGEGLKRQFYRSSRGMGHNLAVMCDRGEGVQQDSSKAAYWYREAAEQGNLNSQHNLSVMYAVGRGVEQDLVQAYMWFNFAAQQGDDEAREMRDLIAEGLSNEQIDRAERLSQILNPRTANDRP